MTIEQKIANADRKTGNVDAVYEDFVLQLSSKLNWENLLSPAPLSIAILGDLMVVGSQFLDTNIDDEVPTGGFQYIKWPKSFTATLLQIGHEGYDAFLKAHTNMDKIRLYSLNVPSYMREATKIIVSKNPSVVKAFLSKPLLRIKEAADQSVILSKEVVDTFNGVMKLMMEVLQAVKSSKTIKTQLRDDTIVNQTFVQRIVDEKKGWLDELENNKKTLLDEMDRAQKDLKSALDSMPTGWRVVAMDFVEGLGNLATLQLGKVFGGDRTTFTPNARDKTNATTSTYHDCVAMHKNDVIKLSHEAENVKNKYATEEALKKIKQDKFDVTKTLKMLEFVGNKTQQCEDIEKIINSGNEAIDMLQDLVNMENTPNESNNTTEPSGEFGKVIDVITTFYNLAKDVSKFLKENTIALPNRTPNLSGGTVEGGRASERAARNARFKAEMAQETLRQARAGLDETRNKMIEINSEYIQHLNEMQSLKISEMRYDEAIKLLQYGLEKLSELRDHWDKLLRFFTQISNLIEIVAGKSLDDFIDMTKSTSQDLALLESQITLDLIYSQAMKASQASYLVHTMSDTYVTVSNNYIMDNIAKLDKYVALDPTKVDLDAERKAFVKSCTEDSEKIVELVVAEKAKLIEKLENRAREIEEEYAFLNEIPVQDDLINDDNVYHF